MKKRKLPVILIIVLFLIIAGVVAFILISKPYKNCGAAGNDGGSYTDSNDEEAVETTKEENEISAKLRDIMRKQVQVTDLTVYYAGDTHMAKANVYLPNYMTLLTEFLDSQTIGDYDEDSQNELLKSFANQLEAQSENAKWDTVEIKVDLSRKAIEIVSSLAYLEENESINPDDYKFEEDEIIDLIINEAVSEQLRALFSNYLENIDWGERGIIPECWEVE